MLNVVVSFPGLQNNGERRSGESYHVICGTGVTCCHLYMYSHAREKTQSCVLYLATKTRQVLAENNIKSTNISKLAPKGWNVSCFSSFSVAGDTNVNMSSCLETGGGECLGMRLECCMSQ